VAAVICQNNGQPDTPTQLSVTWTLSTSTPHFIRRRRQSLRQVTQTPTNRYQLMNAGRGTGPKHRWPALIVN